MRLFLRLLILQSHEFHLENHPGRQDNLVSHPQCISALTLLPNISKQRQREQNRLTERCIINDTRRPYLTMTINQTVC